MNAGTFPSDINPSIVTVKQMSDGVNHVAFIILLQDPTDFAGGL